MKDYRYRILNVFALDGQRLSGNPLCVFEDGRGLDAATMQALALQFNLSETTFILPSERATARVRIFTPSFEMPFAGHPTLGTAHVVRELRNAGDAVSLEMKAGVIPVTATGDTWTLRANAPKRRAVQASRTQLARMLGLAEQEVRDGAAWIDTGADQLIVPLASPDAVARCQPDAALLEKYAKVNDDRYLVYVWADAGADETRVRFFFRKGGSVVEDPGTGSACANLGGWHITHGSKLPLTRRVLQRPSLGGPCELQLGVDAHGAISVGGRVVALGDGFIRL